MISDNFKYLLTNTFNWLVVIVSYNLNGWIDWFTLGAVVAAIVVSILTAIKLRSDYKVNQLKHRSLEMDLEIKNQQLSREIAKNKDSFKNDTK
jgi:hypothetical protein